MGGGARGCGEQVEEACHQTQDWARCCPLRLPVVRGGCRTVLLREAAESGESSAGLSVSPLFSSSPPSFFLLFSLFPFSLLLSHSPRRTFLRTGGWLFLPPRVWGSGWRRVRRAGLGTITAQGSFLGGDCGGSGGGCGRGSPAPASNRTGR